MCEPQAPIVSPQESPRLVVGFALGNWHCVTKTSHVSPAAAGAMCLQTLSENPTSRIGRRPLSPWPQMSYKPQAFLLQYTGVQTLESRQADAIGILFFSVGAREPVWGCLDCARRGEPQRTRAVLFISCFLDLPQILALSTALPICLFHFVVLLSETAPHSPLCR